MNECKLRNIYIYILYTPRTQDHQLLFSIGKGSRAALESILREQGGAPEMQKRALGQQNGA